MAKLSEIIILLSSIRQISIALSITSLEVHETPDNNRIMKKCMLDILASKSQFGSVVAFVNNDDLSNDFLQQIHSLNNVNVFLKGFKGFLEVKTSIHLILAQNLSEFEDLIDNLDRDWYREPEALYIIIVKNISDNVVPAFEILWEYHLIHVLVIVDDQNEDASIYTYFPYSESGCGREYNNTVKLSDCKSAKKWDVVDKLREYDKPVLDNCTLNVGTRHYPPLILCDPDPEDKLTRGMERFLVELILETKNITLNYTCFPETEEAGNISDNFTVSGMMHMLYENEVDLLFGGLSMNNRRVGFFDFLCAHLAYEDMYIPVTHSADRIERWRIVYMMFHVNVWLLLLLMLVICAIMLSNLEKMRIYRNTHTMFELLNLFGNATQNVTLTLRERHYKNCLIIHWLWFIFLMTCFYQTRLTSFTTYRTYKPQVNRYFDLEEYNLAPCIPRDIEQFLKNSGQVPIINEENMKGQECTTSDVALNEIAEVTDKYTVTMYFQYLWWIKNNVKRTEQVYLMKESVYNNMYAVFVKSGFPLLESFNAMMLRLQEHGFVEASKHFHRLPHELGSNVRKILLKLVKAPIKLEDLSVPFCILAIGLVLALIAFVVEITLQRNNFRRCILGEKPN